MSRLYPQPDSANPVLAPDEQTRDGYLYPAGVGSDVVGQAQGWESAPVVEAGGAITGTGSIENAVTALAGDGVVSVSFTGTGSIDSVVTALAATGVETFAGAATLDSIVSALAGVAVETFTGTASLESPVSALAATGVETFTGTGSISNPVTALDGSGVETFTGAGDLANPVSALAATGAQSFTSAGDLASAVTELSAEATETFRGAGSIGSDAEGIPNFPTSELSALGDVASGEITGTGSIDAPVSALAAAGVSEGRTLSAAGGWAGPRSNELRSHYVLALGGLGLPVSRIEAQGFVREKAAALPAVEVVAIPAARPARKRRVLKRLAPLVAVTGRGDVVLPAAVVAGDAVAAPPPVFGVGSVELGVSTVAARGQNLARIVAVAAVDFGPTRLADVGTVEDLDELFVLLDLLEVA